MVMTRDVNAIWKHFNLELRRFIAGKIPSAPDADDVLQEVFLKVLQNQEKILASVDLKSYLYGMVRNAIVDHYRKQKRAGISQVDTVTFSVEEGEVLNQTIANCCLKPFVHKLPDKYRQALLLTEFEGLSQKDLAARLGISYSGAKSRVQRGKEKLKELLLNCCALKSDPYGNIRMEGNEDFGC